MHCHRGKKRQTKSHIFASICVVGLDYLQRAQPYVLIALICVMLMNQSSAWRAAAAPRGHSCTA